MQGRRIFCIGSWFDDGDCADVFTIGVGVNDTYYFLCLVSVFQVFEISVVFHLDGVDVVDSDLCLHGFVAGFYLAGFDVSYLNCCF